MKAGEGKSLLSGQCIYNRLDLGVLGTPEISFHSKKSSKRLLEIKGGHCRLKRGARTVKCEVVLLIYSMISAHLMLQGGS